MAEVTTLARPYAEAVFKLADQSNTLGNWSAALARLGAAAAQTNVRDAISDPRTTTRQLVDLFGSVVDLSASGGETDNFLTLLAENGRLALLPQIYALFEKMKVEAVKLPQPEIHIRGHENARYESVGKVVYTAQRASIMKVGFITEPPPLNQ